MAVLFVIALGSAIAVGGVYAVRLLVSSTRLTASADAALPAAERALATSVAEWDSTARAQQPVRAAVELPPLSSGVPVRRWITRLNPSTYWLVAESATQTSPVVVRRVGVLVRASASGVTVVPDRGWSELP